MRKQAGQAFILVLILLGIGALLVVPALRLTGASLTSSQIVERQVKGLYAADAAQEYILWKLLYDLDWLYETLRDENDSDEFNFYVCDVPVSATVIMRAEEGKGGMTLATEHIIRPTKTVDPAEVDNDFSGSYTYTIKLEQLSEDNSQGLDAVYDVLPDKLNYIPGSSRIRVDGGAWESFPNPDIFTKGTQDRLRWPASGFFDEEVRHFDVRQVKEISFEVTGSLSPNKTHYNWVLLKLGDIDTLSGPVAPIKVGTGAVHVGGLLEVSKLSNPEIILPGELTSILYTIEIKNLDGLTHQIQSLTDYLPPGFDYCTTSPPEPENAITHATCQLPYGITTSNPTSITLMTMDTPEEEDDRYRLYWEFSPPVSIPPYYDEEDILYLYFYARTTKDVSGSYYNEVIVEPDAGINSIFQPDDMTVEEEDFNNSSYSWNSGAVIVPAYDSTSAAGGITINSNMALILGGITITSWQVD
ncbi:hypothetical protein ES703_119246 [subsurface metagenome]